MKQTIILLVFVLVHFVSKGQQLAIEEPIRFLALGDSYTIGQGVDEIFRWPNQLVDSFKKNEFAFEKLDIIARTGWRTDNLLDALALENPSLDYNMVSLLIGVNNQYQGVDFERYSDEFTQLLNQSIKLCGGKKTGVFVLSIPDYGYTPFGTPNREVISEEIDRYNQTNKRITDEMGVAYIDITAISREAEIKPQYVAADNLHPSGAMYAQWVREINNNINLNIPLVTSLEKDASEWQLHPNPALNHVRLISKRAMTSIIVYNLWGFQILSKEAQGQYEFDLDISDLDAGVYYYQILMGESTFGSGKLVVQKM